MANRLQDYQWEYMLNTVTKIHSASSFQEVFTTLASSIFLYVNYQKALCLRIGRQNGEPVLSDYMQLDRSQPGKIWTEDDRFMLGDYPKWEEYIMAPASHVFRQSDFVSKAAWEGSRVYREVWKPLDIYYGLFLCCVHNDRPLALFGFFREENQLDFSFQDAYILDILTNAVEIQLDKLLGASERAGVSVGQRYYNSLVQYDLTKREAEIVSLLCQKEELGAIAKKLYVSPSTMNKHLSNIYKKLGVKNRSELYYKLLKEN